MEIKPDKQKLKGNTANNKPEYFEDKDGLEFNDLSNEFEESANTKKEDKAKEERLRKNREIAQRDYIRVADKFYKRINRPDIYGNTRLVYEDRLKSTISFDLGPAALRYIPTYEGFGMFPSHTNYKQVVSGFFNKYHQLNHVPTKGDFPTISSILNHVFADKIIFALDYIQLLYTKPTQRLPVILLESNEKNSGKSTFGNLLKQIFQNNAIKLGNSDLESEFNAIYISSLCIIVDETSLNKTTIMPMIKRLTTETGGTTSNEKNKAQVVIDFIGKFIFMSNEEGRALAIEKGDTRFAVFKVPTFEEAGIKDIPNIETAIRNEVPAFIFYLLNRDLFYKESGRTYFPKEAYYTKQLEIYYEGSKSYVARQIQAFLNHAFSHFPDEKILHYSVSNLLEQLSTLKYCKPDRAQIKKALEIDLQLMPKNKMRYNYFNVFIAENDLKIPNSIGQNNVVYEFSKDRFSEI